MRRYSVTLAKLDEVAEFLFLDSEPAELADCKRGLMQLELAIGAELHMHSEAIGT